MCKRPDDVPQQPTDTPMLRSLLMTLQHCTASVVAPSGEPQALPPGTRPSSAVLPGPSDELSPRRRQPKRRHGGYERESEEGNSEDEDYVDEMDDPSPTSTASLQRRDRSHVDKPRRRRSSCSDASAGDSPQHIRSTVHHNYHDYASYYDPLDSTRVLLGEASGTSICRLDPTICKVRGGVSSAFPTILHQLLEHARDDGFEDIVSWQPHGRSFHVHNPELFVRNIMPRYFRQTRYSSFQRQLSLYGFLRLTRRGDDHGSYYHELFLRGRVDLCHKIQRQRVKGYGVRQSASPDTEPDFLNMPPAGATGGETYDTLDPLPAALHIPSRLWSTVKAPLPLPPFSEDRRAPMPPLSASHPIAVLRPLRPTASRTFGTLPKECGSLNETLVSTFQHPGSNTASLNVTTAAIGKIDWDPLPLESKDYRNGCWTRRSRSSPRSAPKKSAAFLELPQQEQADLAAFLSDVNLDDSDDDACDDAYRNEWELERIYAAKRARRTLPV